MPLILGIVAVGPIFIFMPLLSGVAVGDCAKAVGVMLRTETIPNNTTTPATTLQNTAGERRSAFLTSG
jgi:hypothetical protein